MLGSQSPWGRKESNMTERLNNRDTFEPAAIMTVFHALMFSNSSTLDLANLHFLDMWIFWPPGNLNLALQRASHAPCPSSACGDGHYDLANVDPGHCALGLSKGTTHTCLEPISSSTEQHLIDTDDMMGWSHTRM